MVGLCLCLLYSHLAAHVLNHDVTWGKRMLCVLQGASTAQLISCRQRTWRPSMLNVVFIKIIIFIRLLCFPLCGVRFSLFVVVLSLSFRCVLCSVNCWRFSLLFGFAGHKQAIRRRTKRGMMPGSIMTRFCINPYPFLWPTLLLLLQRALP